MRLSELIAKLNEIHEFYGDMPVNAVDELGENVPAELVEITNEDEETVAVLLVDAETRFKEADYDDIA